MPVLSHCRAFSFAVLASLTMLAWAVPAHAQAQTQGQATVPAQTADPSSNAGFDVIEFVVEGNSVLSAAMIERAVYPYMGEGKTLSDVDSARAALESVYRERGYLGVSVLIPEQQVRDGIVRLEVVEARVERTRVRDAKYTSPAWVVAQVPSVAQGTVPNFKDFERELAALNRTGLLTATPMLRPGRGVGELDVDLTLEDRKPWSVGVELNNNAAVNTTPLRLGLSARHNNLFERRHSAGIQLVTSPEDTSQVRLGVFNYGIPLGGPDDATLALYAVRANSDTPTSIGGITVVGKQSIFGLRYIKPLREQFGLIHSLTLGVDHKQLDQADLTAQSGFSRVTYLPFTVGYSAIAARDKSQTQADISMGLSIRGVGSEEEEFAQRRYQGSASYMQVRGDLSHEHRLDGWSVRGRVAGQYANQPLIPSEQYAIGGAATVRGYYDSEQLGDLGLLASMEARWRNFEPFESITFLPLAFLDVGEVRIRDPLPEQTSRFKLASVGVGFRSRLGSRSSLSLDVARALTSATFTREGDVRVHVRLVAEF